MVTTGYKACTIVDSRKPAWLVAPRLRNIIYYLLKVRLAAALKISHSQIKVKLFAGRLSVELLQLDTHDPSVLSQMADELWYDGVLIWVLAIVTS